MSVQADRKKWCICQVHQPGFPDAPYYTRLPQYGPWDNERDARQVSELLGRLENPDFALTVRECEDAAEVAPPYKSLPIMAIDETSLPE